MFKPDFVRVPTNGIHLNVAQAGPADGPLLIFLHGFPEFWYGWRNQIEHFAGLGYRVWAPDQRGYNLSDKPDAIRPSEHGFLAYVVEGDVARERVLELGLRTAEGDVEVRRGLAAGREHALLQTLDGAQQGGDRKLFLAVDVCVHHQIDIGSKFHPRAFERYHTGTVYLRSVRVNALAKEHTW